MKHALLFVLAALPVYATFADERPNILWITSEDNGPHLGCYGDSYATTPNLDTLAASGTVYLNCWSNVPVCAPARTAIITGMYPTSLGAQHMRSMVRMPDGFRMFPQYLRDAGYYCTNNRKEDYNVEKPGKVWDVSSGNGHWKNRKDDQPFFAVFNFTVTHESQIRKRPHEPVHDAAKVTVPPYHPDLPEVRQDWAQYYDKLAEMDAKVGEKLKELEDAGLADDTIVFYFGDHGSGMPRHKRSPKNSGVHVPLIVHIPKKFAHLAAHLPAAGESTDRLVSFVDFGPTILSLAGIQPPENMQGKAFLGPFADLERKFIYGTRDRMDERPDMSRSVRDKRYIYIRNYLPQLPNGQHLNYQMITPTTKVWYTEFQKGKLNEVQSAFWIRKPAEELYDLSTDPFETTNLAVDENFASIKERLASASRDWILRTRDTGFMPEPDMHARAGDSTIFEMAHDDERFPLSEIVQVADTQFKANDLTLIVDFIQGNIVDDSAARYWHLKILESRLYGWHEARQIASDMWENDDSPSVQIAAAKIIAQRVSDQDDNGALQKLLEFADLEQHDIYTAIHALNALDELDEKAAPIKDQIAALPREHPSVHQRMNKLVTRLVEKILADLEE